MWHRSFFSLVLALLPAVSSITQDRFVAPLPPDTAVTIRRDLEYSRRGDRPMRFDLYSASGDGTTRPPVAIMLNGIGADWIRAHVQYSSWGRFVTSTLALISPDSAEVQQQFGEALLAGGDTRRAIAAFERSLQLDTPNRGLVTFALVRAYTRLGEIDHAIASLEKLQPFMRYFAQRFREDADLAALRADPRAAKLIGER